MNSLNHELRDDCDVSHPRNEALRFEKIAQGFDESENTKTHFENH